MRAVMAAALVLLCLCLLLLPGSCALTDTSNDDMGQPQGADGGTEADLGDFVCFSGTPQTELQLLNQCTSAQRIDRDPRIPESQWNGKGPLPPAP